MNHHPEGDAVATTALELAREAHDDLMGDVEGACVAYLRLAAANDHPVVALDGGGVLSAREQPLVLHVSGVVQRRGVSAATI